MEIANVKGLALKKQDAKLALYRAKSNLRASSHEYWMMDCVIMGSQNERYHSEHYVHDGHLFRFLKCVSFFQEHAFFIDEWAMMFAIRCTQKDLYEKDKCYLFEIKNSDPHYALLRDLMPLSYTSHITVDVMRNANPIRKIT